MHFFKDFETNKHLVRILELSRKSYGRRPQSISQ